MPTYITTAELALRPGPKELALLASTPEQPVDDYALMDATLRGTDRSAWTAEQAEAADAALARVLDAVTEAEALIDGFVGRRYALPLQLSPTSTGKSVLSVWCRAIVRYKLNRDLVGDESKEPVVRDYKDALRMLGLLADGKYSIGADDPGAASANGGTDVRFQGAAPVFGRAQLRAFR